MNKPRVTIGIPVYNEEENIAFTIRSLLKQKEINFILDKIIILSDASSDNTHSIVRGIQSEKVELVVGRKRKGKAQRCNDLCQRFKGEILILFDCDILLKSQYVISHVVKPFLKYKNVGLVGGNVLPTEGQTFIESAVNKTFDAYYPLRTLLGKKDTIYSCNGPIMALSQQFAKSVRIPQGVISEDAFYYFACISKGFLYKYAKSAKVWYRSPASLKDQILQNKRSILARKQIKQIFGELALKEYFVPRSVMYKLIFTQFIQAPFHSLIIFLINTYSRLIAFRDDAKAHVIWTIAKSTKQKIKDE